jgi:3-oxoacyl-[acyl-carrier protein] reductase
LVTGASSGIGAATARLFAAGGCDVWITYVRNRAGAEETAARCSAGGATVRVSQVDLRSSDSVNGCLEMVAAEWGALNVLVNNGGVCPYTAYDEITIAEWDEVVETNLRGTFLMTHGALVLLRAASGDRAIVNVASVAGQIGGVTTSLHYAASKGGILALTRSYARLLAPEEIRVNAVAPGPIATEITAALSAGARETMRAQTPLRRIGTPEDVAHAILLLGSPESRFTTGATYDVNGGIRID